MSLWRTFFGYSDDDDPQESYPHAVERAKKLLEEENYEDACRILKYSVSNNHPEAMYLYGWCYWRGQGVVEDAGKAVKLWQKSASLGFQPAIDRCEAIKDFIASL